MRQICYLQFSVEILSAERNIFSLTTCLGGLNLINPSESSGLSYTLSRLATDVVVSSLKLHTVFDPDAHSNTLSTVHSEWHTQKMQTLDKIFKSNIQELQRRATQCARDAKIVMAQCSSCCKTSP